jgi:flagellar biosynthesis protein FlhG
MGVIAVGGGKGGVGRTLVASGLAVFIAQLGKKVVLVDGHAFAPTLALSFGVVRTDGTAPPWVVPATDVRGAETVVPNLRVLSANTELGAVPGLALRRPQEIARASGADQCVVDLGFGVGSACIDAMLDADAMVLVTTPEPVAVEAVYRFLRHAYARALVRRLKGHPVEQDAVHKAVRAAGGPPLPPRLAESVARVSRAGAEAAWSTLARLRARLVVNESRSRTDLDLGESMAVLARHRLGVAVEYLGHVEHDDAVALAARRRRPLLVDAPAARASRNLERIARRLLALESGRGERAPQATDHPPEPPTHYDVLALDRGASDEEIRRAYRRMREIYSTESLAIAGLMTAGETAAAVARIEEARDVLLDPARRRPYDLSITRSDELSALAAMAPPARDEPEPQMAPLPEITPETEFSGDLLRAIREARGADLKDVAARTKISVANLRALEAEDYGALPAMVYLRGFVAEFARFLRLDVEQVTRTYLRRYRRAMEGAGARGRV